MTLTQVVKCLMVLLLVRLLQVIPQLATDIADILSPQKVMEPTVLAVVLVSALEAPVRT